MNGDDLLTRATRALRETTEPDSDVVVATTTLARIERTARSTRASTRRRRAYTRWLVVPMAASFVVFAAWASASGRLTRWMSLAPHDAVERAEPMRAPSASTSARAAARSGPPAPPVEPEPEASTPASSGSAPSSAPAPAPAPSPEPSVVHAPERVKRAPAPAPSVDVDALYRDAHEAHFVRHDPAAALSGWDRYLAAAGPSGRFALEARYNRAICLLRLGRRDEAATALRPFANGEYGGYRRDDAAQLLRSLE